MGSGYVIEHCVAAFNAEARRKTFEIYVTDGIKCMTESVAENLGGSYMQRRYVELIEPELVRDERTGDEIAMEVIERAGLIYGN